jgi:phage terminase small subunit
MSTRDLTPKQAEFARQYLLDLNATQAAIRAGYSAKTAQEQASRLLSNVMVRRLVEDLQKARSESTGVTADRVISELARIAFGNQRAVMTWGADGVSLRESSQLTDDEAALVSEVAETVSAAGNGLKLKTHDKVRALELLGKHLGMFVDKVEHSGAIAGGLAERMAAARTRAGA